MGATKVRVNGSLVRKHTLRKDDQIVIADTTILVSNAAPDEARLVVSSAATQKKKERGSNASACRRIAWTLKKMAQLGHYYRDPVPWLDLPLEHYLIHDRGSVS